MTGLLLGQGSPNYQVLPNPTLVSAGRRRESQRGSSLEDMPQGTREQLKGELGLTASGPFRGRRWEICSSHSVGKEVRPREGQWTHVAGAGIKPSGS